MVLKSLSVMRLRPVCSATFRSLRTLTTLVVKDDDSGAAVANKTALELEMVKSLATKGVLDARKVGLDLVLTSEAALGATMTEKYDSTPDSSGSLKVFPSSHVVTLGICKEMY
jgi:hypothetical protein